MSVLLKIENKLGKFINCFGILSAAIMILMMFYVTIDAVMRNVGHSFVGSNELIVNVIVLVIFLGIGQTSVKDAQIKIDVLKSLAWLDHVTLFISFAMYVFAGVAAFSQAQLVFEMSLSSSFLHIPRWPFLIATGFGLILCGLGVICVELRNIAARHKVSGVKIEVKEVNL